MPVKEEVCTGFQKKNKKISALESILNQFLYRRFILICLLSWSHNLTIISRSFLNLPVWKLKLRKFLFIIPRLWGKDDKQIKMRRLYTNLMCSRKKFKITLVPLLYKLLTVLGVSAKTKTNIANKVYGANVMEHKVCTTELIKLDRSSANHTCLISVLYRQLY